MVGTNEPWNLQNHDAPLLYVGWGHHTIVHGYRRDAPRAIIDSATSVIAGLDHPPALDDRTLEETICGLFPASMHPRVTYAGPAYRFAGLGGLPTDAIQITRYNIERLGGEVEGLDLEIDFAQPFVAKLVDGHVAATCETVRKTGITVEAGVETRERYRLRGYGRAVVSAWACKAVEMGLVPLYSASWENRASISLARSLGLIHYGSEFSISGVPLDEPSR